MQVALELLSEHIYILHAEPVQKHDIPFSKHVVLVVNVEHAAGVVVFTVLSIQLNPLVVVLAVVVVLHPAP